MGRDREGPVCKEQLSGKQEANHPAFTPLWQRQQAVPAVLSSTSSYLQNGWNTQGRLLLALLVSWQKGVHYAWTGTKLMEPTFPT